MRSLILLPALVVLAASQSASTTADVNPTPDAIPVDFLKDVEPPTYSTATGLLSQDVPYTTASVVAAASAAVMETPLSVFPAVSTVAINAAGEDDSSQSPTATAAPGKRDIDSNSLDKRKACDIQPSLSLASPLSFATDISYSDFKSNSLIASAALNAPEPTGYFSAFKNKAAANSAYMYMGYTMVKSYDTLGCANRCTAMAGCVAFNIYFERDPSVEPGSGCSNPKPIVNIKCSFWGSALDESTANNDGQWRDQFQVGIAGSNAYTSTKIGGPLDGWTGPANLGNAVMNAPLRDCANTWTYMGYKLLQNGGYDVHNCQAACNAQNDYNTAHPPSSGITPLCAAFGSYLMKVTYKNGTTKDLGQMCTFYTSGWDKQYAVNTAAYDDSIGAKYTWSSSFFYAKPDRQPVCQDIVSSLQSDAAAQTFCSSYINYIPSTSIVSATTTPAVSTSYITMVLTSSTTIFTGTVTTNVAPVKVRNAAPPGHVGARAATPSLLASLGAAARISAACSQVATGATTITSIVATAPTPLTTTTLSTTTTQTVSTVATATVTGTADVLPNGGFEASSNSISPWTSYFRDTGTVQQNVVHAGSNALIVTVYGSFAGSSIQTATTQTVKAGSMYDFSVWILADPEIEQALETGTCTVNVGLPQNQEGGSINGFTSSSTWQKLSWRFTASDDSNLFSVAFGCNPFMSSRFVGKNIYFDDISLVQA
ncbi:carbohydrate-binding-like protein [Neofusicoccum parvum]|nr:carbohydrate-binding-like protein [Neofusicoccum parvum]